MFNANIIVSPLRSCMFLIGGSRVHVFIYVCVCARIFVYTHTQTHTYIYIYISYREPMVNGAIFCGNVEALHTNAHRWMT